MRVPVLARKLKGAHFMQIIKYDKCGMPGNSYLMDTFDKRDSTSVYIQPQGNKSIEIQDVGSLAPFSEIRGPILRTIWHLLNLNG